MSNQLKFKTTITQDTWVVLWSPHQECFHIETLSEMLRTNMGIYAKKSQVDYILLAFAESFDEAHELRDSIRQRLDDQSLSNDSTES